MVFSTSRSQRGFAAGSWDGDSQRQSTTFRRRVSYAIHKLPDLDNLETVPFDKCPSVESGNSKLPEDDYRTTFHNAVFHRQRRRNSPLLDLRLGIKPSIDPRTHIPPLSEPRADISNSSTASQAQAKSSSATPPPSHNATSSSCPTFAATEPPTSPKPATTWPDWRWT